MSFRHTDGSERAGILLFVMVWGIFDLFTVGAATAYSAASPASTCKPSDPVERICSDITSGNFAGAKKTLSNHCSGQDSPLDALSIAFWIELYWAPLPDWPTVIVAATAVYSSISERGGILAMKQVLIKKTVMNDTWQ